MSASKLSRRTFLAASATAVGATGSARVHAQPASDEMWSNWSGSVRFIPQTFAKPTNERAVVEVVQAAARDLKTVRLAGSGHSFVPVCESKHALLSLDRLKGMVSADTKKMQATFWAGTKIHEMGDELAKVGMAMANLGDIDRQAIAGAVSTGTHGTGKGLGSISTQVVGLRLVIANGSTLECSADQNVDVLKAAQVSLGSLGIITLVTLQCLPAYNLHERQWEASFDECVEELDEHIASNRHFEFSWRPQRDV